MEGNNGWILAKGHIRFTTMIICLPYCNAWMDTKLWQKFKMGYDKKKTSGLFIFFATIIETIINKLRDFPSKRWDCTDVKLQCERSLFHSTWKIYIPFSCIGLQNGSFFCVSAVAIFLQKFQVRFVQFFRCFEMMLLKPKITLFI